MHNLDKLPLSETRILQTDQFAALRSKVAAVVDIGFSDRTGSVTDMGDALAGVRNAVDRERDSPASTRA